MSRMNRPTLRLSMVKSGDTIKLRDGGDPRAFTVGAVSEDYVQLENRGKIMLCAKSEPIILIASALDTEAVIE